MAISRTIVRLNKTDNVGITKHGACVACSLIEDGENSAEVVFVLENKVMPPNIVQESLAKNTNKFKVGESVAYEGKRVKIKRAYMYNNKPYYILENKKQVSESKLTIK